MTGVSVRVGFSVSAGGVAVVMTRVVSVDDLWLEEVTAVGSELQEPEHG